MRLNLKDIKNKMREYYMSYIENNDDSYIKLYESLYAVACSGLIPHDTWMKIASYDRELFKAYGA